jgi:hypothetical protein
MQSLHYCHIVFATRQYVCVSVASVLCVHHALYNLATLGMGIATDGLCLSLVSQFYLVQASARNYRPSFGENKPKTLVFNDLIRVFVLSLFSRKRGSINSGTGNLQEDYHSICFVPICKPSQAVITGVFSDFAFPFLQLLLGLAKSLFQEQMSLDR